MSDFTQVVANQSADFVFVLIISKINEPTLAENKEHGWWWWYLYAMRENESFFP